MTESAFKELLDLYVSGSIAEKELASFVELLRQDSNAAAFEAYIEALLANTPAAAGMQRNKADEIFKNIVSTIQDNADTPVVGAGRNYRKAKIFGMLTVAASVIAIVWFSSNFLSHTNRAKPGVSTSTVGPVDPIGLPAAGKKAILTLADGSEVPLQDENNLALPEQGNVEVIKLKGSLQYNLNGSGNREIVYNTISTPAGGQYQVLLQDGSRVWLNSNSSLRFPTAFTGKARQVTLDGEAYFEIAKSAGRPFVVKVDSAEVQVLGTHFNVMAYGNEAALTTTLIEGSVKFVNRQLVKILHPGQQSQRSKDGQVRIIDRVDINKVLSWKEGRFDFDSVDIRSVGRQLERRYDVRVVYKETVKDVFYAKIPLETNLPEVLKILELTGKVHFKIEGKNITISN